MAYIPFEKTAGAGLNRKGENSMDQLIEYSESCLLMEWVQYTVQEAQSADDTRQWRDGMTERGVQPMTTCVQLAATGYTRVPAAYTYEEVSMDGIG